MYVGVEGFTGRVTLTKVVIQAMPTYVMQTTLLRSSVCEEINKICHDFGWGHSSISSKIH